MADPPPRPIQGSWIDTASGAQVEFKHSGSMTEQKPSGAVVDGHYALIDDTHLRVHLSNSVAPIPPVVVGFTVSGNRIQWLDPSGSVLRSFVRGQGQNQ